jgi:hypothetical protein
VKRKSAINANITDKEGGVYYPVRLQFLPRVGDTIELQSYTDAKILHYEVIGISHHVHDIAEKVPQSHEGHHFVHIHVRPLGLTTPEPGLDVFDVIRKLTLLGTTLNSTIDDRSSSGLTVDQVRAAIADGSIFETLAEFPVIKGWALGNLDSDTRARLIAEWQSLASATLAYENFGVTNSGACLLMAYLLQSIQSRENTKVPWPGPEPDM